MTLGGGLRVISGVMGIVGGVAMAVLLGGYDPAPPASWGVSAFCLAFWRVGQFVADEVDRDR
jgi:hypothetical protein